MFVHRLKLRPPQLLASWIERSVEDRLGAEAGVLSVVAGPGYGKTVLAARVYSKWAGPKAWYALDDDDADRAVFVAHLAAMLASLPGAATPHTDPSVLTSPKELGSLFAETVADAAAPPLLVFDDIHVLADSASLAVLAEFVDRASRAGTAFVLGGRSMPLALHSLATRTRLVSVGAGELAFDFDESQAYLALTARTTDREALDRFARRAEGWPAGLALVASTATPVLREGGADLFDARDDRARRVLFDYLAAEVLDDLSEPERAFLLQTAILDVLEPDTCDAIVAGGNARELLPSLARRGVLVTRRSDDAYVVHQLFREFLRDTLARTESAERRAALYRRAAAAHAARGDDVASLGYIVDAGDLDLAASLLERTAFPMLASGLLARVDGFLSRIGRERIERSAALMAVQGRLDHWRGDADRALVILERASSLARQNGDFDVLGQALRVAVTIYAARGDFPRLTTVVNETLSLAGLAESTHTSLSMTLGAILLETGRYDEALATFERIMPAVIAAGDLATQGKMLHNTAVAHVRRGEPYAGLAMYQRALKVKRSGGQRVSAVVTLGNLIYLLRVLGDREEAERLTREMLDEAVDVGNAALVSYALENDGALKLLRGDLAGARAALMGAERECDPADVLVLPDILHGLAQVAFATGDFEEADERCAKALATLRGVRLEHHSAAQILLVRAQCAEARGAFEHALELSLEALGVARSGSDAVTAATVELDAAALIVRIAAKLPPERRDEADRLAATAAADAAALIGQRNYRFLSRTRAATLAQLSPHLRRWGVGRGLMPDADRGTAAPGLRIEMFGGLRVIVAGDALAADVWKRRRARDIFAYLVSLRGKSVSRARLIDVYWPDSDADAAHDNLRVTVSAVRKAVGDVVKFETNGYRFVAPPGATVDVELFDDAIESARQSLAKGSPAEARARYMAAVDLYRGEFLDGFEDGGWHWRERERTQAACLEALRWLVADDGTDASYRRLALDRLLEFAPFDVEAVRARLEAMVADLRYDDARRDYADWRDRYVASIGSEPPDIWEPSRVASPPASERVRA